MSQKEGIVENFLGHFDKKRAMKLLDEWVWIDPDTKQRQCIVVDTSGKSDIENMLYVLQPQEVPDFLMGCKEFWAGSKLPEWAQEKEEVFRNSF